MTKTCGLIGVFGLLAACSGGGRSYSFDDPKPDPSADPASGVVVTVGTVEGEDRPDGGPLTDASLPPKTDEDGAAPPTPDGGPPPLVATFGVVASWLHACALTARGTVACWGDNEQGQIAPGLSETIATSPVAVPKLEDAVAVAAGVAQSCAIRAGGTVVCWGGADGSPTASKLVTVPGVESARRIAAGGQTCVLRSDQTVVCWAPSITPYPIAVRDLGSVTAIAATIGAQCALRAGGDVMCWGTNGHGELGDGTTNDSGTPVRVSGLTDATELASSGATTCALRRTGAVVCWGNLTSSPDALVPAVLPGISDAAAIAVGVDHACTANKDGVLCLGSNSYGELGDGTTVPAQSPVLVTKRPMLRIAAGFHFTCASDEKTVSCWGYNGYGQLGTGSTEKESLVPVTVTGL